MTDKDKIISILEAGLQAKTADETKECLWWALQIIQGNEVNIPKEVFTSNRAVWRK